MSNDSGIAITSTIADSTTLIATPLTVAHGKGDNSGAAVNAFLVSIQDRVNGEPSFCYLTPEQAIEAGEWLIKMGKSAKLARKV
jgi:hypothetical protein